MHTIEIISTKNAPEPIGPYSQAIKVGNTVYISGQIGLLPNKNQLVSEDFKEQAEQIFNNLAALAQASGSDLKNIIKLTVYVKDLANFQILNEVMREYFVVPYPVRVAVEVSELPLQAQIEIDAILVLD